MKYYRLRLRRRSGRTVVVTMAAESARKARQEANVLYAPWWRVVDVVPKENRP